MATDFRQAQILFSLTHLHSITMLYFYYRPDVSWVPLYTAVT